MSNGSLNRVYLIGNLGADPELKFTNSGKAVLQMRLATSEKFKNQAGEWQEKTEWHTAVIWEKRAEALNKILGKGSKLCIEGKLQTRQWDDKDGNKRYSTEVIARDVILLGGKGKGQSDFGGGSGFNDNSFDAGSVGDDDIPF